MDTTPKFSKEPIKYFHTCRNSHKHRHKSEKRIYIWAGPHSKKVVEPDDERKNRDHDKSPNH